MIVPGLRSEASYIIMLVAPIGDHESTSYPQLVCTRSDGASA
jgi:hypothetical protein